MCLIALSNSPSFTFTLLYFLLLINKVVGGGPTGVELAAELSDFVQTDVARLFPSLVGKVSVGSSANI